MMDCEITQKLHKEFPKQFYEKGTPCWSSVPKGWEGIVREALRKIDEKKIDIKWDQIKEKFAGLRLYPISDNLVVDLYKELNEIIIEAEVKSMKTCMECGKEGVRKVRNNWLSVYCDNCEKTEG